ncbi:hypothetical protein O1L60_39330 [Streptomyces diastatochromogenes]|nr:hypothetical protein [Streptomyces diastatochromogenes]MCZ0982947.1 hypothetical protein [Streptomyces diastatochromogenes]
MSCKFDRNLSKTWIQKAWGTNTKVVIEPESKVTAIGASLPIWTGPGAAIALITPTYTTCALYTDNGQLASGSLPAQIPAAGLSEEELHSSRATVLAALDQTTAYVVDKTGPAYERTLTGYGVTAASDDPSIKPDKAADLRATTSSLSAKTALRQGIRAYTASAPQLLSTGTIWPAS